MARTSDTKQRIQDAARELFAEQGVQRTSLQDIADKLGITKPALYYHFSSREDLVRSIVLPLVDGFEAFVVAQEATAASPRALLEEFFDLNYVHRHEFVLVLTELNLLTDLGLIDRTVTWRERLARLLFRGEPTLAQAARAVIALGGLQDCTVQFAGAPVADLRKAAVDGALSALGFS